MKLALALVAILVPGSAGLAQDFKCSGTEPFWSLAISDRQIRFSSPETEYDLAPAEPSPARGMAPDYLRVYRTKKASGASDPVTIVLQQAPGAQCSDGMSDAEYAYFGVLITGSEVLSGCCRPQ